MRRNLVWIGGLAALLFLILSGCMLQQTNDAALTEETLLPTVSPTLPPTATREEGRGIFTLVATPEPSPPASIPESRRLVLEWPLKIRQGDSDIVRLALEMDESGALTPTAEFGDHEVRGEPVAIPNLYDTHKVTAEAWLDLAGVAITPADKIQQELRPGESVTFYWSLRPQETGVYRGAAWMQLNIEPRLEGEVLQLTLQPQTLEIRVVNLFGIDGRTARLLGSLGSLVGAVFSIDDILAWVRKRWGGKDKTGRDDN